jgi:hypothetical protein
MVFPAGFFLSGLQYGVLAGKRRDVAATPAPADLGFGMGDDDIIRFH